jgi:tetratricopeptide (TPR) repeat protein
MQMHTIISYEQLINWENSLSNYEQKSVAITFSTQLEELERQYPDSSNLLMVLSFFDPESIPLHMITEGAEGSAEDLGINITSDAVDASATMAELESLISMIRSPVQFQQAIQQLHRLSLVGYESTKITPALRIHDLIQVVIQERTRRRDRQHLWFRVAMALLSRAFRQVHDVQSPMYWARCEMFNPHIQSLTKWDDGGTIRNPELYQANIAIARYLRSRGRYDEAEMLFSHVLRGNEKLFGPDHPDTLGIGLHLATVYHWQGRHNEAELLGLRVLAGYEKQFGHDRIETLRVVHNLAEMCRSQERHSEAETLYMRALTGYEKDLGPEHRDLLWANSGLANIYRSQGRYEESETLFKRVLTGYEKIRGIEYPDTYTLGTVVGLALNYQSQGRHEDADRLFRKALEGSEKLLGVEHPNTLLAIHNLAYHLGCSSQGQYTEAETLYRRALAGTENNLGPKHPHTLAVVRNFITFLEAKGAPEEVTLLQNRLRPVLEPYRTCHMLYQAPTQ